MPVGATSSELVSIPDTSQQLGNGQVFKHTVCLSSGESEPIDFMHERSYFFCNGRVTQKECDF